MRRLADVNDTTFSPRFRGGSSDDGDGLAVVSTMPALDYATITTCARPTAKALLRLTDYWRSKVSGGALPNRDSIDPTEIIVHLPWLFMADVIEGGADYRYRLIGTSITSANYRDVTGRSFRELYGADTTKLEGARLGFDLACSTRAPIYTQGRAFWRPDWSYDRFEAAFLPLSVDGDTVNIILGEIAYLAAL
jgi:hypothetical protein